MDNNLNDRLSPEAMLEQLARLANIHYGDLFRAIHNGNLEAAKGYVQAIEHLEGLAAYAKMPEDGQTWWWVSGLSESNNPTEIYTLYGTFVKQIEYMGG